MSNDYLLDTAVLAYAIGGEHRYRAACQAVVALAAESGVTFFASVEMVQELAFHRMRRVDRSQAVDEAKAAGDICTLLDFNHDVLIRSLDLITSVSTVRGRDAVHAATALNHDIDKVISPDVAFDQIPGLTRVDPFDVRS